MKEPLRTFNQYREVLGTVLVGYFDEHGAPKGMYSKNGTGVTAIDDGVVVGEGRCNGRTERGASFAAPVVAVKLLVGRLLWPERGDLTDAMSARLRLLRSASVRKEYFGHYWSGGPAAPQRLYAPMGHYLVSQDGTTKDATNLARRLTVMVEVQLSTGLKLVPYLFDPEDVDPSNGFLVLQLQDDSAFLLERTRQGLPAWQAVKPVSICFCTDDTTFIPVSEVRDILKEVARND
jgi:hypothetical protein